MQIYPNFASGLKLKSFPLNFNWLPTVGQLIDELEYSINTVERNSRYLIDKFQESCLQQACYFTKNRSDNDIHTFKSLLYGFMKVN